ncbi:MAG: DUF58 domain-containing protein [Myxococcales bacterium]|nr:DUF58 domain-containing protein [Myxococcales bacterium]
MPGAEDSPVSTGDLARAARLLLLRSRCEATGLFAGNYTSAFRGGGLEFDESRPYVPGDDIRSIDWNATARSAEPFVKLFREDRNQTLLFALDVSGSMDFGSTGSPKAATAAHALALMAAAAVRAGDRIGLVAFDGSVRASVPIGRGAAHSLRVIRTAVETAAASRGTTRLSAGLRALHAAARRRAAVVLISDFRDPELFPPTGSSAPAAALAELARRHDVVAAAVVDPREAAIPDAGPIRVADPERPGAVFVLATGSRRARERYRAAGAAWRRRLEDELRRSGADPVWLRTDRSPLLALGSFFRERAARRRREGV